MKKSIFHMTGFAVTTVLFCILYITCNDSGANSESLSNEGKADKFVGKFNKGANTHTTFGNSGTFYYGGQKYKTVKIGNQWWMAQNLNYETDSDSWCYNYNPDNCNTYGRLYTWNVAKNVCPSGWHLPSREEWDNLIAVCGSNEAGKYLKAKQGWKDNSNGTDDFGFSALPGGLRATNGVFVDADEIGHWWQAMESSSGTALGLNIGYRSDAMYWLNTSKGYGLSARCVMGDIVDGVPPSTSTTVTTPPIISGDTLYYDGQAYKTVEIDGKIWMAENLNYPTSSDSWCYDNDSSNCNDYGRLYDWHTAMKVCPSGWRLPSREDWDNLIAVCGSNEAGKYLKANHGWKDNGNGTDGYGFSALPGGLRATNGVFVDATEIGHWWQATESSSGSALGLDMGYRNDGAYWLNISKGDGLSVRCVKE